MSVIKMLSVTVMAGLLVGCPSNKKAWAQTAGQATGQATGGPAGAAGGPSAGAMVPSRNSAATTPISPQLPITSPPQMGTGPEAQGTLPSGTLATQTGNNPNGLNNAPGTNPSVDELNRPNTNSATGSRIPASGANGNSAYGPGTTGAGTQTVPGTNNGARPSPSPSTFFE